MRGLLGQYVLAGAVSTFGLLGHAAYAQEVDPPVENPEVKPPAQGLGIGVVEPGDAGLEEIIVTGTRTGETKLQSTAIAITAITTETLDRTGVDDVRDLVQVVPNLLIAQNNAFSQVYIRGIGSNNAFAGSDPSSTIHLDGVYLARPAQVLTNFLDVERVEVLRGPQGTLYGRNSVGGTINIISRQAGNTLEAKAQFTYGNYDLVRGEAYISGPIVEDKAAASVSLMRSTRDGYLENIAIPRNRVDDEDLLSGRAQLRLTPTDRFELTVRADYFYADEALAGYIKILEPSPVDPLVNTILGDLRKVALNIPSNSKRRQWGIAADAEYDLGGDHVLRSLTAYRAGTLRAANDSDATSQNIRLTQQFEGQNQFSQEFNVSHQSSLLRYIAGVYYFKENIEADSPVTNFVPGVQGRPNPLVNTEAWAAYGQATFFVLPGLGLTAGLRYTVEEKDFTQRFNVIRLATGASLPGFPLTYETGDTYKALTPKFGLEYQVSRDLFLYASATRGFKSGGFNFSSRNPNQGYEPENLWSYEAGFKSDFLDRRIRLNGTAFYYDYSDLQVQSFITPGVVDITNAANATVKGIEIELLAKPVNSFVLGGNLAYLDARYSDYPTALLPGNRVFDASGNRLNSAPEWAYNVFAQYDFSLGGSGTAYLRGDYSYKSRQFFSPQNFLLESQPSYGLLGASAGYISPGDRWRLMLFARNITDEEYVTTTATFTGQVSGRIGDPQTYGVRVAIKY